MKVKNDHDNKREKTNAVIWTVKLLGRYQILIFNKINKNHTTVLQTKSCFDTTNKPLVETQPVGSNC